MEKKLKSKSNKASTKTKATNSKSKKMILKDLPTLALVDIVAFPKVSHSVLLGKEKSIKAVQEALKNKSTVFLVVKKSSAKGENSENDILNQNDIYQIGVVANIERVLNEESGDVRIHVEGVYKAKIKKFINNEDYYKADVEVIEEGKNLTYSRNALKLKEEILHYFSLEVMYQTLAEDFLSMIEGVEDLNHFTNLIGAYYNFEINDAQYLLEENNVEKKLEFIKNKISLDIEKILLIEDIKQKTVTNISEEQRKYYLREQLKTIRKDLGEEVDENVEIESLYEKLKSKEYPEEVKKEINWNLNRLKRLAPEMSEYASLRSYLDWVMDLPWCDKTKDDFNIKRVKKVLNEDHYGLDDIKLRILEFLSVKKMNQDANGPVLCLVGPPGVGKTSLGKSIARALNRKFFRIALGGVRDEAEIRGHRKTYVGALPGRIIQGLKETQSKNPVFLLDELDKVGADFRGDPASALLEVLDPAQNKDFRDHFIDMGFDLSEVLFIATANGINTIPDPLLDRLELIQLTGYTSEEKLAICQRYIIPRQLKQNAIEDKHVTFKENAILFIIEKYTRESGVRELERVIGTVCRKLAYQYNLTGSLDKTVTMKVVTKLLGGIRYDVEPREMKDSIGYVNGMAWTSVGGELLPIEVSVAKGMGHLSLTGQLGNVMQESAQTAFFYVRANAKKYGINEEFYKDLDVHIHAPNGAVPKDGPSAGVTICTALLSALANKKFPHNVAMTGEITLRGNVLPVGGVKEKVLAAIRQGVTTIFLPKDNLCDIPKTKEKVKFYGVSHVSEILEKTIFTK